MKLPPLVFGTLLRRYKRFLADVKLEDGSVVTAHCPNTGRMTTCAEPGWKVALSDSHNPKRKYRHTWELVHNGACWICVNTGRANAMAFEAVSKGWIPELAGYAEVLREQTFGDSRFDLLLRGAAIPPSFYHGDTEARRDGKLRDSEPPAKREVKNGGELCHVEVKSVTLLAADGSYAFPDAVTARGRKHLAGLVDAVKAGHRAAMLFAIARSDGAGFRIADEIDPGYFQALEAAMAAGVEALAWRAKVSPEELRLVEPVAICGI